MTAYDEHIKDDPKRIPQPSRHPDLFESPVMERAADAAATLSGQGKGDVPSDIQGSYTGTPADAGHPEQDADDL
ncbi:MAG: hypothetical protein ACOYJY_03740 [Acutalibacteraceae bacterium]|jgi:hypothetical protein